MSLSSSPLKYRKDNDEEEVIDINQILFTNVAGRIEEDPLLYEQKNNNNDDDDDPDDDRMFGTPKG